MPRFIVTHDMTNCTHEQLLDCTRRLAGSVPPNTDWLQSWWIVEKNKLMCEWVAETADAVRTSLEPAGDLIPIESIYEVQLINPKWFA